METLEKIRNAALAHKAEITCFMIGVLVGELCFYRRIGKAVKRTVMSINE